MDWMKPEKGLEEKKMIEVAGREDEEGLRRVGRLPEAARSRALRRQQERNATDRRREERRGSF